MATIKTNKTYLTNHVDGYNFVVEENCHATVKAVHTTKWGVMYDVSVAEHEPYYFNVFESEIENFLKVV